MADDPQPQPPTRLGRLLLAAVGLAVIAIVAFAGGVLLLGDSLPTVPVLSWPVLSLNANENAGDGGPDEIEAIPTETGTPAQSLAAEASPPAPDPTGQPATQSADPTGTPTTPAETATPTPPPATATTTATSTATATPAPPATPEAVVSANVLNLRAGPGTNYPVVGQVLAQQRFAISGRNQAADWLRVCCPAGEDAESWISAEYAESSAPVTDLPVAPAPPTPVPSPTPVPPPLPAAPAQANPAAELARPAPGLPGPGGFGPPGGTNPLTGLPLPPGRNGQRPVVVCINNDIAARPQFGLSQADVMVEYVMEGFSITRFSGVFYGSDSAQIGPVRSARLINYYMGALYDAGLFCSGASDGVRFELKHNAPFPYLDVDLDDPANNRYSVSVGSDYRTRLRTSSAGMRRWLAEWGVERAPSLRGFTFGGLASGGAPAGAISIPYPSVTASQVAYRFDPGSGRYLRFLGGAAHADGNSGQQIAVENVIVQYVPHQPTEIVEDSLGSKSIRLNLFGTGKAILFRDGLAFEGTWRSDSRGDLPRFFGPDGGEVPLKPGRTWISVVPLSYTIGYQ